MRFDKFALKFGIVEFPDIVRISVDRWVMRHAMVWLVCACKAAPRVQAIANWQTAAPQNPEYRP
jgi:hypothetical protein